MEDKEHTLRTTQFEWLVTFSTIQRLERQLRELRITALVLTITTFAIGLGVLSIAQIASPMIQTALTMSALWWAMTYAFSLALQFSPSFMRPFGYSERIELERLDPKEAAEYLETARYLARRLARITRMVTMLTVMGISIVAISIAYTLLLSMR